MVIFTEDGGEMVDLDLATEIGVGSDLAERKLAFRPAATTFDVDLKAIEPDAFETSGNVVFSDGAIGAAHLSALPTAAPIATLTPDAASRSMRAACSPDCAVADAALENAAEKVLPADAIGFAMSDIYFATLVPLSAVPPTEPLCCTLIVTFATAALILAAAAEP